MRTKLYLWSLLISSFGGYINGRNSANLELFIDKTILTLCDKEVVIFNIGWLKEIHNLTTIEIQIPSFVICLQVTEYSFEQGVDLFRKGFKRKDEMFL
jgi:hypothetical protein